MRIIVGCVIVGVCLYWVVLRRFVIGRQQWVIWPILVAIVVGVFTANEYRWYRFETKLAHAVKPIAGDRDITIGCERLFRNFFSSQGYSGHVMFDGNGNPAAEAFLSSSTCSNIKKFMKDPKTFELDQIEAVHTLSHEAAHLAGLRNESSAECLALNNDPLVMRELGATVEHGEKLRGLYMKLVYPQLPTEYNSPRCELDDVTDD